MGSGVWANGSPKGWRELRAYILERDSYRCMIKGPRCRGKATQVHHILGAQLTGVVCSPDLLQAACFPCNRGAGQPKNVEVSIRPMTQW